jgi:ribosomal protein L7/L12
MPRCPFCDCENPAGARTCRNCRADLPNSDGPDSPTNAGDLVELIKRGEKIGAVKLYRQQNGASLKDAVEAVNAMERGEPAPQPQDASTGAIQDADLKAVDLKAIVSLLEEGKTIAAIKLYREKTRVGLAAAKSSVEKLASERGIQLPRSGCAGVILVCLLVCLVAAGVVSSL